MQRLQGWAMPGTFEEQQEEAEEVVESQPREVEATSDGSQTQLVMGHGEELGCILSRVEPWKDFKPRSDTDPDTTCKHGWEMTDPASPIEQGR